MRYATLLPFVGAATAFVILDETKAEHLALDEEAKAEKTLSSWWDSFHSLNELRSVAETVNGDLDLLQEGFSKSSDFLPDIEFESDFDGLFSSSESDRPGHGRHGHHGHHGKPNQTIYQTIQSAKYFTKFTKLINEYPDIVEALNSTKANHTVFVPLDKAFEKIPDHAKKPSKEFLEKLIQYHIIPGFYPAGRLVAHHTLPTALDESELNGNPQRLRFHLGVFGLRINFYAKVLGANLWAKNGVIHALGDIVAPPPPVNILVSLFPSTFSTLLLAAEKTGLHKDKDTTTTGLTIFTPTNWAFQKLGPAANAFLFNSEKGLKYLKALLLYHSVVNETLYSDAYYGKSDTDGELETDNSNFHIDLPTLLGDKHLSIDISRFFGFVTMKINGFTTVATQDGVGKDGVIQIVDSVLIPPHEHKGFWNEDDGEIAVDDLIERLQPYAEPEWAGEL
jgi:uncharacterized surface protein with fasciclin (FAS1) repeats